LRPFVVRKMARRKRGPAARAGAAGRAHPAEFGASARPAGGRGAGPSPVSGPRFWPGF